MPPKKTAVAPKTAQIYAVVGSDEGAVKSRARELAQQLTPKDTGDFGQDLIDGAADNADQAVSRIHSAIEAIQTVPFFGPGKLVWLKDVNFCGDTVTGRSAQVVAALHAYRAWLDAHMSSFKAGGFAVGVVENLAGTYVPYVGRELKLTIALVLIVVVLMFRPSGMFGRSVVSRV